MAGQINEWIDLLVEMTGLEGYAILLITLPLGIIQGLFGIFPFATLIMMQVLLLGISGGLFASWLVGTVSAFVVYVLCKYVLADWFNRRWLSKIDKYNKRMDQVQVYGGWAIIFLRTIPVMPNNLISFLGAVTNMKMTTYLWSNMIGNLSHIWLFGIISAAILFPQMDVRFLITSYIGFCLVLITVFIVRYNQFYKHERHS
jgi:uncharacterized membrane protein YdjX (TVP38/TMEM64 family)